MNHVRIIIVIRGAEKLLRQNSEVQLKSSECFAARISCKMLEAFTEGVHCNYNYTPTKFPWGYMPNVQNCLAIVRQAGEWSWHVLMFRCAYDI